MDISTIRKQYPQYDDIPDGDLVNGFHSKFYSDIDKGEFHKMVGYSQGVPNRPDFAKVVPQEPVQQEEPSIAKSVKDGVADFIQLPSRMMEHALNTMPTGNLKQDGTIGNGLIDDVANGVAKNAHTVQSLAGQAVAPVVSSAMGTKDNYANDFVKYNQGKIEDLNKENTQNNIVDGKAVQHQNPFYEASNMVTHPLNAVGGGAVESVLGKALHGLAVGASFPVVDAVAEGKSPNIKDMTTSGLTMATLSSLIGVLTKGKAKLSNDGKIEAVPTETQKTQTEVPNSMTPEEVTIVNGIAKQLEHPKPEEVSQALDKPDTYNGQVIPIPKDIIAKQIEIINNKNSTPMQIKQARDVLTVAKAEEKRNQPTINKPETPQGKSLDEQMELIRTHDRGGEEQAQNYKAQMQSWADRKNANRVEQGLEPTVTADDMARENYINYENKAKPTDAELNTLYETSTDANGNFKTIGDRNKSHGWQDAQNTDAYGQEYTTRMAGERGLDSEITTPVQILKKLKEEGYNALSDAERAIVDRDIDTIRNHPDFKTLEQKDNGTHINESGELVDADGNYLFQGVKSKEQKEKRGIYNVQNNDKSSTIIYKDADFAENTIKYEQGKENEHTGSGYGAMHIEKHLDSSKDGWVSQKELLNIGNAIRNTKPYENNGKRVYEYHNEQGTRFRAVVGDMKNGERTISFFSDRKAGFGNDSRNYSFNQPSNGIISQNIKGSYSIDSKLIKIFETHDVSTLNHELGHRFLFTLDAKEKGIAEQVFGVKNGEWKTEHYEAFADAYARYIAEGKTPVSGLKAIFEKFREFTKNILFALKENNGGKLPPLSADAKLFFSATLGHEPSRVKLFEKFKAEDSKASTESGELYQTASQREHLKEVYKDSDPLTKNEDGTPKVFYHGTKGNFSEFKKDAKVVNGTAQGEGFYFTTYPKTASSYAKSGSVMPVYLNAKNLFIGIDNLTPLQREYYLKTEKPENDILKDLGFDGRALRDNEVIVFDNTQIKSIHNKPLSEGKSPDFENSNILYQLSKDLLATKQHSTIGDEVTRLKANMAKFKSVVSDVTKEISSYFKDLTPDYYKNIKEDRTIGIAKATDKAELIHQALIQLSDNTRKVLHNAIVGDIKDLPKGYEELAPIVKAIQSEVKNMSKKFVDLGMMSEKDAEIWGENYLKRSYEKHWNTKGDIQSSNNTGVKPIIARGKELKSSDIEEIYNFADDALHVNSKKGLGTQMSIEDIKQHLEDEGILGENIRDGKVIWIEDANGKVTLRRDWTKAERENMGELEDAAVTVPNTLMSMGMMIENAKMMKELSTHAVHFTDEADAKAQGYERIPMTKRYGAVAGLFVDKEIASRLKIAFEDRGLLREVYAKANTVFKVTHTAWNSASHINNFLGNMYTLFLMGRNTKEALQMLKGTFGAGQKYLSLTVKEYEKLVAGEFIGNLSQKQEARLTELKSSLKYYIEGKEAGLFGRGFITDVLRGYDAKTKTFDSKGLVSKAIDKVSDIYGKGDDIPRLSAYETLRKNGMSAKEAKEYVTALFPDYTKDLPTGIRWLRNSGIAPFISWSYYVLPNIAKLSKEHPMRATSALAVTYIGSALLSGINPFGDDLPDDAKGRRIPINKDGTTLKVDRMIPGFDFASLPIDILAQIVSGVNRGDVGYGVNKAIQAGAKDTGNLAKSYLWGGIPSMALDMLQNKDSYSGRSISGESGDVSKQAYNYAKYGASAFTPSIAQNIATLLESKIIDKEDRKKHKEVEPRTTTQELLKLAGFNTMTYNMNEVQKKRDREYLKKMRE